MGMRFNTQSLTLSVALVMVATACATSDRLDPTAAPSTSLPAITTSTGAQTTTTSAFTSPTTTTTAAAPVDLEAELAASRWDGACEDLLDDRLGLVEDLISTYEHLPIETVNRVLTGDETFFERSNELTALEGDLECSQIHLRILMLDRIDSVPHSTTTGQLIKAQVMGLSISGFGYDDLYKFVPLIIDYDRPQSWPVLSPWQEPSTCIQVWDGQIDVLSYLAGLLAAEPNLSEENPEYGAVFTQMDERFGQLDAAQSELGCDPYEGARYHVATSARTAAEDFWDAMAKYLILWAATSTLDEPFSPPVDPEAVARDLDRKSVV